MAARPIWLCLLQAFAFLVLINHQCRRRFFKAVVLEPTPASSRLSEMAGHKIAHATLKGPSVVKEIVIGAVLGLVAGGLWKMHHWNEPSYLVLA
ncbi:uncharacterized protein LOC133714463 [Rosa rugosa]|uniref:uncharacterized protein LOC133714463 n=1 Tax=Rosa rugosa TaxID=74645 RepID=UPI002B406A27|nr:uncharacterized protein LOC133714463 [Rosa rugosa]